MDYDAILLASDRYAKLKALELAISLYKDHGFTSDGMIVVAQNFYNFLTGEKKNEEVSN